MLIRKRLNLARYFILTACLVCGLLSFSSWGFNQIMAMVVCSVGISIGLFVLVHCVVELTTGIQKSAPHPIRQKKLIWPLVFKFLLIAGVLIGSVHFMDNLVLFPIFLYVGQIIILFFCLKKV